MKTLIVLIALCIFATPAMSAGVIKEVCRDRVDKAGKTVRECKKIKVHKKLKGTPVPVKK